MIEVRLRLPESASWWTIVRCLTPEAAAEVVRILLSQEGLSSEEILLVKERDCGRISN